jgi:cell wall-associated NlpC family hydrolase
MKKLLIAIVALPVVLVLLVMVIIGGLSTGIIGGNSPSQDAQADIPANYLILYQRAADTCPGLPWPVLAGIGKIETNHGRSTLPGVTSGANFAGAAGPMQMGVGVGAAGDAFWRFAVDGNNDGRRSPYDPADAIPSAAAYMCKALRDNGGDLSRAIFAYNHAQWYVDKVLAIASGYAATAGPGPQLGAPALSVIDGALQFAYNQLGKPYRWGGTGEGGFYDCSGLTLRAYQSGGLQLPRTAAMQWNAGQHITDPGAVQAGDLVFYAHDLSNPATIHHVGIYIGAGNMINAPHAGAVIRIQPAFRGDYIGAVRPTSR